MALEAFDLPVLFLRILSYTEQSLNLKIKESPGTLMKKKKSMCFTDFDSGICACCRLEAYRSGSSVYFRKSDCRKYSRAGDDPSGRTVRGTSESCTDL